MRVGKLSGKVDDFSGCEGRSLQEILCSFKGPAMKQFTLFFAAIFPQASAVLLGGRFVGRFLSGDGMVLDL